MSLSRDWEKPGWGSHPEAERRGRSKGRGGGSCRLARNTSAYSDQKTGGTKRRVELGRNGTRVEKKRSPPNPTL